MFCAVGRATFIDIYYNIHHDLYSFLSLIGHNYIDLSVLAIVEQYLSNFLGYYELPFHNLEKFLSCYILALTLQ